MDILISNLLSESIFDVGKWSNWKYANTRICVFSVWLPEVENWFRKQICNKNVHISILNFFFEEFRSLFWKVQKWISHCIFKKWFDRGRVYFLAKHFSEKAKLPEICLSFGGSMPEAQIWKVSDNPRTKNWWETEARWLQYLYVDNSLSVRNKLTFVDALSRFIGIQCKHLLVILTMLYSVNSDSTQTPVSNPFKAVLSKLSLS